jgi:hypothetical protein
LFSINVFSQWSANPGQNTELIQETNNPFNLFAVEDNIGGTFVVWQDTKQSNTSDLFFQHINVDGGVTFRADGRRVSLLKGSKNTPVCSNVYKNTMVVLWKDLSAGNKGDLYAQKVQTNGNILWGENGVSLFHSKNEIINYSCITDRNGFNYVAFIEKDEKTPSNYILRVQKLSMDGKFVFKDWIKIASSNFAKYSANIFSDNNGGAYILWVENENKLNQVHAHYIDSTGKIVWQKEHLNISGHYANVISYKAIQINPGLIYVCWQSHIKQKKIFHQLLNSKGNVLFEQNGRSVSSGNNQSNPHPILATDSTIIISWIDENNNNKDVCVQKFKLNGKSVWNEMKIFAFDSLNSQFGQAIVSDGKGGAIIAFFEKEKSKNQPDIFIQRINKRGEFIWNKNSLPVANYSNSEKSYLNLLSDQSNGVVAVFKEKRNGLTCIYGQRIHGNGTYTSQVVDFATSLVGDSVLITWRTVNEKDVFVYKIDRLMDNKSDSSWSEIYSVISGASLKTNIYQFLDYPNETGTIYYRLRRISRSGEIIFSDVLRVDFAEEQIDEPYIYQNVPNPFSDSTSISFIVPGETSARLEFYNSRVELINEKVFENIQPGKIKYVFHAVELPPGIYFYRFTAGEFVQVKKMVITR